jgi:two-component system, OmpR family, phosphate regulon sensor histidine kinase PhoR
MPDTDQHFLRSHSWQVSIGRLVVLVAASILIGWWLGNISSALVCAFAVYVVWSLSSLMRLQRWVMGRNRTAPPSDMGVWSDIASFVHSRHQAGKQRRRRLVQLLRAYREAAEALPDGVMVLSNTRQLVWSNASARRLLGLDKYSHRGQVIDHLIHNRQILEWLSAERAEQPLIDVPSPVNSDMRLSMRLIPYAERQWLLVVRDISTLLKLEQVRRDFVANVSHELRTPLTVIHGYLDLVEPGEFPESGDMILEMRRQSTRMTQIVEDLLTLSRLDAQEGLNDEPVSMSAMLSLLKREAEALSGGQHRIEVHLDCRRDLLGSAKDLHSAFSNLVFNAVRYTPPGGSIDIVWRDLSDGACLSVQDTGHGIPPEHLPRITERFYRVSTSRSREKGGTGLGLSIAKHVLALHQARLRIESELGVGSTFFCEFPAARLETIAPAGGTSASMPLQQIADTDRTITQ